MTRTINLTTNVPADRKVNIVLPSDVPVGPAEMEIRVTPSEEKILTVGDFLRSEFFGMWRNRTDIEDSVEFAQRLRAEAWSRGE
ncbi:MAG: hypothetical protein HY276_09855 [Ignavibacteriales bacterium]|nr:hypothetical protein [Ignavibacteriales bacterium]